MSDRRRKSDRTKHLLRSVLRVDVDLIHSVRLAELVQVNTREWAEYMSSKGGLVMFPDNVLHVGKKRNKRYAC